MRTTISIDDDGYAEVKEYAERRDIALGKAVSDLVRRALDAPFRMKFDGQFWVADLPPDSATITLEHMKKVQEEMDLEDLKKALGKFD
jgi:hypothetical protein